MNIEKIILSFESGWVESCVNEIYTMDRFVKIVKKTEDISTFMLNKKICFTHRKYDCTNHKCYISHDEMYDLYYELDNINKIKEKIEKKIKLNTNAIRSHDD